MKRQPILGASPDFAKALSGRPRRGRFYSSGIHPASRAPVVSVLKALYTYEAPAYYHGVIPGRYCLACLNALNTHCCSQRPRRGKR